MSQPLYVAVFTNTFHGRQRAAGPFANEDACTEWIDKQEDRALWRAVPLEVVG